jgi:hypothetical protein
VKIVKVTYDMDEAESYVGDAIINHESRMLTVMNDIENIIINLDTVKHFKTYDIPQQFMDSKPIFHHYLKDHMVEITLDKAISLYNEINGL